MHGYGRYIQTNGEYFIGNFSQGKKHGEGKYFNQNNEKVQEGKWVNDKFEGYSSGPIQFNKSPSKRLTLPPKKLAANVEKLYSGKPTTAVTKSNEQQPPPAGSQQKPFMNSFATKK